MAVPAPSGAASSHAKRKQSMNDRDFAREAAGPGEYQHRPPGPRSQPIELDHDHAVGGQSESESESAGDALYHQPPRVRTARGTTAPRHYFESTSNEDADEDLELEPPRRSTRDQSFTARGQSVAAQPEPDHLQRFVDATATTRPGTRQAATLAELQKSEQAWQAEFEAKQNITLEQYEGFAELETKLALYENAFGAYGDQVQQLRRLANINKGNVLAAKSAAAVPATGPAPSRVYSLNTTTAANFKALPAYQPPPALAARRNEEQKRAAQPSIED